MNNETIISKLQNFKKPDKNFVKNKECIINK